MKRTIAALFITFGLIGAGTAPAQAHELNPNYCARYAHAGNAKHCPHKRYPNLTAYLTAIRAANASRFGTITLTGWTR